MDIKKYYIILLLLLIGIGVAHSQETRRETGTDFRTDRDFVDADTLVIVR